MPERPAVVNALLDKLFGITQDPVCILLILIIVWLLYDRIRMVRALADSHAYEREVHLAMKEAAFERTAFTRSMSGIAERMHRETDDAP